MMSSVLAINQYTLDTAVKRMNAFEISGFEQRKCQIIRGAIRPTILSIESLQTLEIFNGQDSWLYMHP